MNDKKRITKLLLEVQKGQKKSYDMLFSVVYERLKNIARHHLAREYNNHTLSKTSLVHEVYMKMIDQTEIEWQDRAHFYGIASRCMRQILVDYARKTKAIKRGRNYDHVSLERDEIDLVQHADQLIELNDLIDKLAEFDERKSHVVEMRFFGDMTIREISEILGVSTRTIDRDWLKARAWLHKELKN